MRTAKTFIAAFAGACALALTATTSFAASEFEGVWTVKDTKGTAFDITLAADGKASADRDGEGMSGTWKEDGGAAVITWSEGWTTKIVKSGDGYKKTASQGDKEVNSSDAVKK